MFEVDSKQSNPDIYDVLTTSLDFLNCRGFPFCLFCCAEDTNVLNLHFCSDFQSLEDCCDGGIELSSFSHLIYHPIKR